MNYNDAYATTENKTHKFQDKIHSDAINAQNVLTKENLFTKLYPCVAYNKLKEYPHRTDDASTHYIDDDTKILYSYNYRDKVWDYCDKDHKFYNNCLKKFISANLYSP